MTNIESIYHGPDGTTYIAYMTDQSGIQLMKLSGVVQGHLPSGLLSAGLAHGSCTCGPAVHGSCPCDPAASRLEFGLAVQMHFIVAFSDGALGFKPIRLTVLERMLGLEQLGYSS